MNTRFRSPARQGHTRAHGWVRPAQARLPSLVRKLLLIVVVGLHAVVLLGAVAVPAYAIGETLRAALAASDAGQIGAVLAIDRWLVLLGNTAVVCGVALLTALAVGLVVGIVLARTDLPGRSLFAALAVFGACLPVYVTMVFVLSCLPVSKLTDSALACGLLYGLIYSPLAIVVLGATFRCADRELEDLARLDAGPRTVLLRVTIPQAGWGIAILGVLILLLVGTDFTITDLLFVRTFAEEVYTQFELRGSAAGPVLTSIPMLFILAGLLIAVQARYRLLGEHTPWQFGEPPPTIPLGRWRAPLAFVGLMLVLALAGRPAAALLGRIESFEGFLSAADALKRELLVSALLAALGATVVVVCSVGLAVVLLRGRRLRVPVGVAAVVLLATPAPLVGISLIWLLNRPGCLGWLYDSPVIIVIGYVVRFLPIGILLLAAAVRRVPRSIESAARLDGCDWLAVQRHVYWPAVIGEAAMVWLVVVILCFAEVGATTLLAPPGWNTASVRAFSLMHYGVYGNLAVLAILSVGIIFVLWSPLAWLLRRRFARPRPALPQGI